MESEQINKTPDLREPEEYIESKILTRFVEKQLIETSLPTLNSISKFLTIVEEIKEKREKLLMLQKKIKDLVYRLALKPFEIKEFESLYKEYTLTKIYCGGRAFLKLDCKQYSIRQLIEAITNRVLPKFKWIEISNVKFIKAKVLNEFIENSIPQNQDSFSIAYEKNAS